MRLVGTSEALPKGACSHHQLPNCITNAVDTRVAPNQRHTSAHARREIANDLAACSSVAPIRKGDL